MTKSCKYSKDHLLISANTIDGKQKLNLEEIGKF